jgi:hypothetical protein
VINPTFTIDGDLEIQRRFLTAGSRMRNAVMAAILGLVTEGQEKARSLAPIASKDWKWGSTGRYGRGALRRGIKSWISGDEELGGDLTRAEKAKYRALAKDKDGIVGVVVSTHYTGRFFEAGVDVTRSANAAKRTAAYLAYTRSYNSGLKGRARSLAKKAGAENRDRMYGPISFETHMKLHNRAERAYKRTFERMNKKTTYERRYWVKQIPFMAPTIAMLDAKIEPTIKAAVDKAVADG